MQQQSDHVPHYDHWQDQFVVWLPTIQKQIRFAFGGLAIDSRDEAIQEALANCCVQFERLHQQGRAEVASPRSLAQFAIQQGRAGRTVATKMNSHEPLSRYAQQRRGIKVEQLEVAVDSETWLPVFVDDRRVSVADQAALRIDTREWLARLSDRLRRIAGDLALGFSTSEVATRYRLSPARISQLRSELYESWLAFQGLLPAGTA